MSLRAIESMITFELREMLGEKRLRVKDIQEWSTLEISQRDGELVVRVVTVCGVFFAAVRCVDVPHYMARTGGGKKVCRA